MIDRTPKVFISYSWTSKEYQESVIALASRLRHDGVDVKLDVWDLKDGQDKYKFMEQCVADPGIDKVLILSDKAYSEKADQRRGGVGDETTIISAEVYGNADQQKFIPVVMERDAEGNPYLPVYLKTRKYRDLSGNNYEDEYEFLLRTIFEAPAQRKPELGLPPAFLTEDCPDNLYTIKKVANELRASVLGKMCGADSRDFVDAYIEAMKQFYSRDVTKDTYLVSFTAMKEYRDVFLEHLKALSISEHFGTTVADEFEQLYNALNCVYTFDPDTKQYGNSVFDIFCVHIWELFVCSVAFMLHFNLFGDIHELLVHTYFLTSGFSSAKKPFSYEQFRFYSRVMEEYIKPTMGEDLRTKYTLIGHFVCSERENLPIYSAKAMANADLFLYQVYNGLKLDGLEGYGMWFPTLYVYADQYDSMWKKLISKRFCERVMPIFGVNTIEALKDRISKCVPDRECRYRQGWASPATAILSWIKLDDIATLP